VSPGAHALALPAGVALILAGLAVMWVVRRRGAAAETIDALLGAVLSPLGDAAILLDARGRILRANAAAARLMAMTERELVGSDAAVLGHELAVLRHGLARGPAEAAVTIPFGAGPVRAKAALVRLGGRRPVDLLVLRPLAAAPERPPPLPRPPPPPDPHDARALLGAVGASLKAPVARAAAAASYVRLLAPPLPARAAERLDELEAALDDASRRLAALAAAAEHVASAARPIDLAPLVADVVAAFPAPAGVRVRTSLRPAVAFADDRPLRAAVREALRAVAAGTHRGGEIAVVVSGRGTSAVVEVTGGAGEGADGIAAVARALVAPHGGRVEDEVAPGRGRALRLLLPLAAEPTHIAAPAVAPRV
jgi:PAS domain-containing protein